jgi:hypothetical protein
MTQFLAETRERFLLAIAEQVAADRIAEIHFFKPIKQGGIESGVAVVALVMPHVEGQGHSHEGSSLPARHTVLTAHYRLTLKGLDRGKWQVTVVEEGDAPLITVETVVRGVQRRAGDLDDPERMEGDAIRDALTAAAPRQTS